MQNVTMRRYAAPYSLTCLVVFMGTLQSTVVTLVMEHKPNVWAIGFDMNLLAAAYAVSSFISIFHTHTHHSFKYEDFLLNYFNSILTT